MFLGYSVHAEIPQGVKAMKKTRKRRNTGSCREKDCERVAEKHKVKGVVYFKSRCRKHRIISPRMKARLKIKSRWFRKGKGTTFAEFEKLIVSPCMACGWNKANCDIHRIIHGKDGGKYEKGNTVVLCPNCHRLEHRGKLTAQIGEAIINLKV